MGALQEPVTDLEFRVKSLRQEREGREFGGSVHLRFHCSSLTYNLDLYQAGVWNHSSLSRLQAPYPTHPLHVRSVLAALTWFFISIFKSLYIEAALSSFFLLGLCLASRRDAIERQRFSEPCSAPPGRFSHRISYLEWSVSHVACLFYVGL